MTSGSGRPWEGVENGKCRECDGQMALVVGMPSSFVCRLLALGFPPPCVPCDDDELCKKVCVYAVLVWADMV